MGGRLEFKFLLELIWLLELGVLSLFLFPLAVSIPLSVKSSSSKLRETVGEFSSGSSFELFLARACWVEWLSFESSAPFIAECFLCSHKHVLEILNDVFDI